MPVISFTAAIAVARLFRYFSVGFLAVRYGSQALPFISQHKLQVAVATMALVAVSYGLSRLLFDGKEEPKHGAADNES